MKICSNCGRKINDEDVFCKECGTQVDNAGSDILSSNQPTLTNDNDIKKLVKKKGCIIAVILVVIVVIICSFTMCGVSNSSEKPTKSQNTQIPAETIETPTLEPAPTPFPTPTPEPVVKEFVRENYGYVDYKELARNPDSYIGKSISYSGKVIQVMEGDTEVHHRIAVNGSYDSVIYVAYPKDMVASRILEDDYVTVYGISMGLYSYQSTGSGQITIPSIYLDRIELQSN